MGPSVDPVRIGQRIHIVPTLEHGTWQDHTLINEGAAVPVNPKADSLPLSMRGIIPLTTGSAPISCATMTRSTASGFGTA